MATLSRIFPLMSLLLVLAACGGSTPQAPSNLNYPSGTVTAVVGQPLAAIQPTLNGTARFEVSPPFPAGLALDPATGAIQGTPAEPAAARAYLVTARNDGGAVSAEVSLEVAAQMPDLRYRWAGEFKSYTGTGAAYTIGVPLGGRAVFGFEGLAQWGPLTIYAPAGDGWTASGYQPLVPLVGGASSVYYADRMENLDADLADLIGQGKVITSLDVSLTGFGVVATGPTGDPGQYTQVVARLANQDALAAWAAAQGRDGAVVTAVTTLGNDAAGNAPAGPILAVATRRRGDAQVESTLVAQGTAAELAELLPGYGAQGWRVTAFGSADLGARRYLVVLSARFGPVAPVDLRVVVAGTPGAPSMTGPYVLVGSMMDLATGTLASVWER